MREGHYAIFAAMEAMDCGMASPAIWTANS